MSITFEEKITIAILSVFLIIGVIFLYVRDARPAGGISIVHGGIKKVYSLEDLTKELKEKNKVCINTASEEELTRIPEVGPKMAARIKEYRDKFGPFLSESELLDVKGIGEKKLEKMREMIRMK